jgi:hypothetical protein
MPKCQVDDRSMMGYKSRAWHSACAHSTCPTRARFRDCPWYHKLAIGQFQISVIAGRGRAWIGIVGFAHSRVWVVCFQLLPLHLLALIAYCSVIQFHLHSCHKRCGKFCLLLRVPDL